MKNSELKRKNNKRMADIGKLQLAIIVCNLLIDVLVLIKTILT